MSIAPKRFARATCSSGEGLLAEKEHVVFDEGAVEPVEIGIGQGLSQIETRDEAADRAGQPFDFETHCEPPSASDEDSGTYISPQRFE